MIAWKLIPILHNAPIFSACLMQNIPLSHAPHSTHRMAPNFDTLINTNWLSDQCVSWSFPSTLPPVMSIPFQGSVWFANGDLHVNAFSSSPECHKGFLMLINITSGACVGHPCTQVLRCTQLMRAPTQPHTHSHKLLHLRTETAHPLNPWMHYW